MQARSFRPAIEAVVCLLLASSCAHRVKDCRLFPSLEAAECEQAGDGRIVVKPGSIARAAFGSEGLSAILVDGRTFYFVNRHGKTEPALAFDNGPDYVSEGLARTVKNGKVGFVNTRLDVVIAPVWDFAFPFERGSARVCTGCVPTGGEHKTTMGGKWGYIDQRGTVVVPVVYDAAALPPGPR